MPLGLVPVVLLLGSGALVGATLGLVGGGGSVLAVPLLVYLVGVPSTHVAIGSSALAVAVNAAWGLASHARLGTVKWPCGLVFGAADVGGGAGGRSRRQAAWRNRTSRGFRCGDGRHRFLFAFGQPPA